MMHSFNEPMISPVLVGRAAECDLLHRKIDQVKTGMGQVVLISGEAGIGKSRLVRDTIAYATTSGFLVLKGACFAPDIHCPYAPILDLLRDYFSNDSLDRVSSHEFLTREHFSLLPDVVPLVVSETRIKSATEPEQEQRRLFAVLVQCLKLLAHRQPLLFVIEDIHWSDNTSLEFLHYLMRRTINQPVFVLFTDRLEDNSDYVQSWLAQLDRERLFYELHLTRLMLPDVKTMLATMPGTVHLSGTDLLRTVYELTDGNPFFIEEFLKSLKESGILDRLTHDDRHLTLHRLHIPRTINNAVQQRFDQLDDATRHIGALAAVIGRRFDFALLQALTSWDDDKIVQSIKQLIGSFLIVEESADQFAFRHALSQQAIYATLLGREQKNLHQKIAEVIETLYADRLTLHIENLAYHFYIIGHWEKSLQYSIQAGEQALHLFAPTTAIEHFSHAIEAAEALGSTLVLSLYQKRGQCYEMSGHFEHAQANYKIALNLARTEHNDSAEWRSLIALGFLWSSRQYEQAGEYYRQALQLARIQSDPLMLAHTLNRFGNWYLNIEEAGMAQQYHQEALAIFESLNAPAGIAETLDLLGLAACLGGELHAGADFLARAATYFRELDDRAGLASCLATATLSGMTCQTNTMISPDVPLIVVTQGGETALQIARANGLRSSETYALSTLSFCLGSMGDFGRALALAEQAVALAVDIEHRQWTIIALVARGVLFWDVLALTEAQQSLELALRISQEIGSLHWQRTTSGFLASVYIAQNALTQARKVIEVALQPNTPVQTVGQRLCWVADAELALAQGDTNGALNIIDKLSNLRKYDTGNSSSVLPRVDLLRGQILGQLNRFSEAETILQAVDRAVEFHGARPLGWRTHIALGNVYLAHSQPDAAEAHFTEAQTIIGMLASGISDTTLNAQFLNRAIAKIPESSRLQPAKKTSGDLTRRERDVAKLITQGMSNREIGETLVVSERTIETHVSNIFNKLGFTSRSQIAVWATERGLHTLPSAD